jgi:hypothetical protein
LRREQQDLKLATAELLQERAIEQRMLAYHGRDHVGTDVAPLSGHLPNTLDQSADIARLGDITQGAQAEDTVEYHLGVVNGVDQYTRLGIELADAPKRFKPPVADHGKVHHHHVGAMVAIPGVGLLAASDITLHDQAGLPRERAAQTGAQGGMIVHQQHV